MLKWTERVIAFRAKGRCTPEDIWDASSSRSCLVAEAAEILGIDYGTANDRLSPHVRVPEGIGSVGGGFPSYLMSGNLAAAERLCHEVDDALVVLKRETPA